MFPSPIWELNFTIDERGCLYCVSDYPLFCNCINLTLDQHIHKSVLTHLLCETIGNFELGAKHANIRYNQIGKLFPCNIYIQHGSFL